MATMMMCGHAANGIKYSETIGEPPQECCLICMHKPESVIPDPRSPGLVGRMMRCGYDKGDGCGKPKRSSVKPSDVNAAFFEYRGAGSRHAEESCTKCSYKKVAHTAGSKVVVSHEFAPNAAGNAYDDYYCGCFGWD